MNGLSLHRFTTNILIDTTNDRLDKAPDDRPRPEPTARLSSCAKGVKSFPRKNSFEMPLPVSETVRITFRSLFQSLFASRFDEFWDFSSVSRRSRT